MTPENVVLTGDCVEVMATLDAESVDAIVTDPPYLIGFMGKHWDGPAAFVERKSVRRAGSFESAHGNHNPTDSADAVRTRRSENRRAQDWHALWAREALRVAKPGAHLLAFGGTRTYHRLASAIEDAGWEIRDCLVWAYASGFPKSLNFPDGWGTALKPAWEPIVMARKPTLGTVKANREAFGTGALNIDGTRIAMADGDGRNEPGPNGGRTGPAWRAMEGRIVRRTAQPADVGMLSQGERPVGEIASANPAGRWPANVILTDPIFDGGVEGVVGSPEGRSSGHINESNGDAGWFGAQTSAIPGVNTYGDSGTYSRFFLIPKADRADREPVIYPDGHDRTKRLTTHPTVKPVDLMRHLVRLVTPSGGLVLDPFLGSGTTAIACELEGFRWLGIEKEPEYVAIAEARLNGTQRGLGLAG